MADFGKVILGEGKLYFDYGELAEAVAGYVKGATFTENITYRAIEVDGKKGNTIGDKIVESVMPQLEVTMMEIISTEWVKAFGAITVDATTPAETSITRDLSVVAGDYLTNVAYVGKTKDGKDVVVKILNAYGEGGMELAFADKSEVEIPVMFTGNYSTIDDTTAPYEIIIDEA